MESGFRAAQAWVEITTDLDGSQIERAAHDAARRADSALTDGMSDTGDRISTTLGKAGERGGDNLIKSVEGKVKRDADRSFRPFHESAGKIGGAAGGFFSDSMIKAASPVIAANAPTLAAVLAGGIVAAPALGAIGLGIALALQDEKIKEAASETGAYIGSELRTAAAPFKGELLDVFAQGRHASDKWGPQLNAIFGNASKYLRPLATGVEHMVDYSLPGIGKAVREAEPVVNSLRMAFERVGDATGNMFSTLADDAKEGASAIDDVSLSVENLIRTTTLITHAGATVKGWTDQLDVAIDKGRYWMEDNSWLAKGFKDLGVQIDFTADGFNVGTREAEAYRKATLGVATDTDFAILKTAGMTDAQITGIDASGKYRAGLDKAAGGMVALRGEANNAIPGVRSLADIMDDFAGRTIGAEQAQSRLESAIDNATRAAKENGDGIDRNKPKQRANRDALIEIANAARFAAKKVKDQTGSAEEASKVNERGRAAFLKAAAAMHVSASEANALARELFGIPPERKPKVTVQDAQAKAALAAIKHGIATIHNKEVTVTVKYETHGSIQGEHTIGVGTQLKAEGGEILGGSGVRDDVPVLAMGGEWMIRRKAVKALERRFGPGIMHELNNADRINGGRSTGKSRIGGDKHDPVDRSVAAIGGVDRSSVATLPPRTSYHFAPGSITLDASKIRSVADLVSMVEGLTGATRAYSAGSM